MDRVLDSFFNPGTPQSPNTPSTPAVTHSSFCSTSSLDVSRASPEIHELIAQPSSSPSSSPQTKTIHSDPINLAAVSAAEGASCVTEKPQRGHAPHVPSSLSTSRPLPLRGVNEHKSSPNLQSDLCEAVCVSSIDGLSTSERRPTGLTLLRDDDNNLDEDLNLSGDTPLDQRSSSTLVADDASTQSAAGGQSSSDSPGVFFFHAKPRLNQFVGLIRFLLIRGKLHSTGRALQSMTPEETAVHDKFISYPVVESLAEAVTQVLKKEPNMLEIQVPEDELLIVVGDIHGQFMDMYCSVLAQQFSEEHNPNQVDKRFLFLGDLVDRGPFSVEVCLLVMALKVEFPDLVHVTRGNHEESKTSRVYGFLTESQAKFGENGTWAWEKMNQAFRHIPLCAIVRTPKMSFFATHGGISPALHDDVGTIAKVERAAYCYTLKGEQEDLVNGLLWSDPTVDVGTYTRNPRGCGVQFGRLATDSFCSHNNVDFICRAHQVVMDGYCWQHRDKIVTVFSAPNYCGINDNLGAIMVVRGDAKKPTFVQYEAFEMDDDECAPALDCNFAYASCFQ